MEEERKGSRGTTITDLGTLLVHSSDQRRSGSALDDPSSDCPHKGSSLYGSGGNVSPIADVRRAAQRVRFVPSAEFARNHAQPLTFIIHSDVPPELTSERIYLLLHIVDFG